MSTWKHVGMSYLKYADLCASHVRNSLKEPKKSKADALSKMHARVMKWEDGKRLKPGHSRPRPWEGSADRGIGALPARLHAHAR